MSLSCYCEYDPEPGDVVWWKPQDYTVYARNRRTKCCSCGNTISHGDTCLEFDRSKIPDSEIECRIYGEDGEIPRASWWMCETCGDLFWSLDELGFDCISLSDNMRELVKEYAAIYGPEGRAS